MQRITGALTGFVRFVSKTDENPVALFPAFLASALMLSVIQAPIGWAAPAWVAVVPFILVCTPSQQPKRLAICAYVVGLGYWLLNLYWIVPITMVGWVALCAYTAVLWPVVGLALRYCRQKKVPLLLAVPVLFVGAERLQGLFLGGFFWRFLAHSQYANLTLIQIADIFGTAGLSFLIALVNALIADWITVIGRRRSFSTGNLLKTTLVCAALTVTIFYGRWRIRQSDNCISTGPVICSLQSNVPQSVKRTGEASDVIFANLAEKSRAAAEAGARLIVWPETMTQAILNKEVWPLLNTLPLETAKAFDEALSELANGSSYLLVGAYGAGVKSGQDSSGYLASYNSAFLYTPKGIQDPKQYRKIHLVPFGEFVPFRRRLPALYNFLMKFTPYNYDYSLDAGSEYTVFEMAGRDNQGCRFGVMICYEDTVPAISRRFATDRWGHKKVDYLVNISNDGWFVRFREGRVLPSTELAQHAAVCVFRAVENRLAVVRSVNTGISCIIDPLGRIKDGYAAGNLPSRAMKRQGMAGWFVDELPIDNRVTWFSKYGQWLDLCCAFCLAAATIIPAGTALMRRRKRVKKDNKKH